MQRRRLLTGAGLLAAGALSAPRIARAASSVIRFAPQADLPNLDPVSGTQQVVRNAAVMVWDMLYGVDATLTPQPQMCEGHALSDDGKTWTFRLRSGLLFHDATPVLARDVVASVNRWMARDTMGQLLKARLDALEAVDDRTFRFRLNAPFSKLLFALGKTSSPALLIMPERIASTDPFKQINEFVGSGPMVFKRDEWMAGSRAVFERNPHYQPRPEPASWLAGGKRMLVDRVEWITMPDPATASSALQSGEIDWWENPIPDLVPLLKADRNITCDIADTLGNVGVFRTNHLHPPFNDQRARQAMQLAIKQEDYMRAIVGDDPALWQTMAGFFTPGTPGYTEVGGERLKGPRQIDLAKKMLADAGYNGEKIVMLVAADVEMVKAQCDVTADMLKTLGMAVDYQALDWGTVGARRTSKAAPDKGGWHIIHTWLGGIDCINPAPYKILDASGAGAWFGWPKSDAAMAAIGDWYAAAGPAAEKQALDRVNQVSMDYVTFVPTGFFRSFTASRRTLSGVAKAPLPLFWGVSKA